LSSASCRYRHTSSQPTLDNTIHSKFASWPIHAKARQLVEMCDLGSDLELKRLLSVCLVAVLTGGHAAHASGRHLSSCGRGEGLHARRDTPRQPQGSQGGTHHTHPHSRVGQASPSSKRRDRHSPLP
jgi:hypothetical protein